MESFFQSPVFGEFQEKIPYRGKSWMIETKHASCLVIRQKLPLGFCWLWVPYGPVRHDRGPVEKIFEEIARVAKKERAIFARVEPPADLHPLSHNDNRPIFPASKRYTPEHTLILDIEKSEEEILAQMKPKGRYNIRVARKYHLQISTFSGSAFRPGTDFDEFYEILRATGSRDAFGIHPKFFYEELLRTFEKNAQLLLAKKDNRVIAGIIVIFYKDTATYYYGASDYKHRSLMAPYFLQWEAILEAKKRDMKHYDFLGIAPADALRHPLAGVTGFKKKFGGREVSYPKAFDVVYKPILYRIFRI